MINKILAFFLGFLLIGTIPISIGMSSCWDGFDKGISWKPVIPLKKATFVDFDMDTYLDDYSYLAAVPTSIFYSENANEGSLFAHPLLFYQDPYPVTDDKERSLDARMGIDYFMEDWISACDNWMDEMVLINVPEKKVDQWPARNITVIEENDPYSIAEELSLHDWSYSTDAVVAIINESLKQPEKCIENTLKGSVSGETIHKQLTVNRSKGSSPEYEYFEIPRDYQFVSVDVWYPSISILKDRLLYSTLMGPGGMTFPSVDQDIQLYCNHDDFGWLMVEASSEMTIQEGPHERVSSYVYTPGEWKIGVTNIPTEKIEVNGGLVRALLQMLVPVKEYNADINLYPGEEIIIPDLPPYGCSNCTVKLSWSTRDANLGFSVIGPLGENIVTVYNDSDSFHETCQEVTIDQLGECLENEYYKISVFTLKETRQPIDFSIAYQWEQKISRETGDSLTSATQGAVLASLLNCPLLYATYDNVPQATHDALTALQVKKIHLINLGDHISNHAYRELKRMGTVYSHNESEDIYDEIMCRSGRHDVIFSTLDPWTAWYVNPTANVTNTMPLAGEYPGALYIGPAAYLAACHGSPVLFVDNHPELSAAITWHNDYWKKNPDGMKVPSVAVMTMTGKRIYDFLDKLGFDKEGKESIVTVAGQFDIGIAWSRVFAGRAKSGRFIGTPVDTSIWISRNLFYPVLIFENPALAGSVTLINGSQSVRVQPTFFRPFKRFFARLSSLTSGLSNLKIIKPSQEELYNYPVLHTYCCYSHRFNERGSKFWGEKYILANGDIPGETISYESIDQDVRLKYENIYGGYLPDMSDSEITPLYCQRAGYDNVFSSNFSSIIQNLNRGVISWYEMVHGGQNLGGNLDLWDPRTMEICLIEQFGLPPFLAKVIQLLAAGPLGLFPLDDTNPWRGYEQLWGSTVEPDSATANTEIGLLLGILGAAHPQGILNGGYIKTGLDFIPANIRFSVLPKARESYYDGMVLGIGISQILTRTYFAYGSMQIDDALQNIHSCSINAGSCLIGGKYLTLVLIRHGAVFMECDPWSTSYWGSSHFMGVPRGLALGKTVGETYDEGMEKVGITYIAEEGEQIDWWWDTKQNIIFFGDPDLRVWVPGTTYSDDNYWEKPTFISYDNTLSLQGHMPFGSLTQPQEKSSILDIPLQFIIIIAIIALGITTIIILDIKSKKND